MSTNLKPSVPKNLLTIYGRKPVVEALENPAIEFFRVHLAVSNQKSDIIRDIKKLCQQRGIEILEHDRLSLSRISKNRKQDQGVAADIICQQFVELDQALAQQPKSLIALDNVTNPQNLGLIIRSICAGYVDGLLLPRKGCARLDALVIKASAGTLFNAPLIFCQQLEPALKQCQSAGYQIIGLAIDEDGLNSTPLPAVDRSQPHIWVLGNETDGISEQIKSYCDQLAYIPMRNQVESLNVSAVASILAFAPLFQDT